MDNSLAIGIFVKAGFDFTVAATILAKNDVHPLSTNL